MTSDLFPAPIAENIWDLKYRYKLDGRPVDITVEDTWRRIATALAQAEAPDRREHWTQVFYEALRGFKFLPAGRIVSGAGTGRNVTLFNCYVMGTIPDSMVGIFDNLKEAALTMQQGGGIGYDFSTLRPKGAPVVGVGADASGPLTFMDVWDAMCRTVMSAGSRRGAMMATMRCDHPDIEAFIEAKHDPQRLRMFNLSVLVTDEFMDAMENDHDWRLHFENRRGETLVEKTVRARDLWDKIMRSTYDSAEPGVIFVDRINRRNNLNYVEKIASTNPCGEQPLPPYGACLLGSINLAVLVKNAFTAEAGLDIPALTALVKTAVRMMDNVVDISKFPLPQQEEEAKKKRRIGLGVTGLADALLMCGVTYGSRDAVMVTESWMKALTEAAYMASADLAAEKGAFPAFSVDGILGEGTFASGLELHVQNAIRRHGLRNSHLTSIAPTGTISLYAGNLSGGIEPIFAAEHDRKVLQPDGSRITETVRDYAIQVWHDMGLDQAETEEGIVFQPPPGYVDAQTLSPLDHVRMQAAAQKWVDSSISKTVNVPVDASFESFKEIYLSAWHSGCKGCTTYRPNKITGSVLSVKEEPKPLIVESNSPDKDAWDEAMKKAKPEITWSGPPVEQALLKRPDELPGVVYKLKPPSSGHAVYITITDIEDNGRRRPFEIFINSKNVDHQAWTVALTRMISAIFRRPHDSRFVVEELKAVFDPRGGFWDKGTYQPSILAAIGSVIETHMKSIGYIDDVKEDLDAALARIEGMPVENPVDIGIPPKTCPSCFSTNVKAESGCFVCGDCGDSKCG